MTTERNVPPSLDCKYTTQLSRSDNSLLKRLSDVSGYSPQQIGRYAIKKYLQEKVTENPSLIGG